MGGGASSLLNVLSEGRRDSPNNLGPWWLAAGGVGVRSPNDSGGGVRTTGCDDAPCIASNNQVSN